ncbi:serine hydrolase domain-containing protein [Nitrosopumilus sp. b2]|uniref:serine hydrolase domain-containing protein n=1 Tax=Nitrosopumilus sp. b2 TaxID=2109908 RepID=UPI0015F60530|nr:serine hydrolase domain-containing protein [Nitrosopumilus sp. b2]
MAIEEIIENHVKSGKSPGISVGLVNENETMTFNFGETKKDSGVVPTNKTIYEIGSMTKTFTTILAAQLQAEEIISLDEKISKYLPELENSEFENKNVTLRHLLTHTSGISEFSVKTFASQIFSIMSTGKSRIVEYEYDTEKFLNYVSALKLKNSPGSTWMYSNLGFGLVGKILERITGNSYDVLVKTHICDVLDMKDTGIDVFESHKDELAVGYSFRGKQADYWNVPAIEAAGSLYSTPSDMVKFLKANLGLSKTILYPVFEYCQNTKNTPKIPLSMKFFTKSVGISLHSFRAGWFVFPQENVDILGHDGGTEGFSSFMCMNLGNQSAVVILTNRAMKPVHKLGLSLLQEINKK